MALRHSLGLGTEAEAVENAVDEALDQGFRTADIAGGEAHVGTEEMGSAVAERI